MSALNSSQEEKYINKTVLFDTLTTNKNRGMPSFNIADNIGFLLSSLGDGSSRVFFKKLNLINI